MKVFKMKCGDSLQVGDCRLDFRHFAEVVVDSPEDISVHRIPAENRHCGKMKRRCGPAALDKPPRSRQG